jgi:hypothetical protein
MKKSIITFRTSITSRRGQSLVEAIVALSILTVGFLGITTLLTKSFQINRINGDETTATYLASEGIEVTKNLIDHDVYEGIAAGPASGIGGWGKCFPSPFTIYYKIDYQTTDCSSLVYTLIPHLFPIYYDSLTGLYGDDSALGPQTIYSRAIAVTNNGNMIDVQSTVTWSPTPVSTQSVKVEDQFYNWHPLSN